MASYTPNRKMLIDGQLVDSSSGKFFDNVNPATEEVIGQVADGTHEDMQRAIAAARRAFEETDWSTNHKFRQRCLEQLQAGLEAEVEEIRAELVDEVGCPVQLTYGPQLAGPLEDALTWPAQAIDSFDWETEMPERMVYGTMSKRIIRKEPVGVVGAITAWNYPFELMMSKFGPILAAGNTTVLKPSNLTPFSATRFARIIAEKTDIPAGVVNIVTSDDHMVGEDLTLSRDVDMISFTGSTAVGKRIMEKGAPTLKRIFLELGGKSVLIVTEDADLTAVLPMSAMVCSHAGQGCAILTRYLVPRSRYQEAIEIMRATLSSIPYGDPTDMATVQGPQISALQRQRVLDLIASGVAQGAKLELGGGRPAHLEKGYFVEPTLFSNVDNTMDIAQQEIFGPVAVVIPFDDDEDAIRIANQSNYGLSGGVWSGDPERAMAMARRIRTGTLMVNGGAYFGPDVPFGGYKDSGIGRQGGLNGMNQYLEVKTIGYPA
jgi:aldehyde dehydrogenase (NAD+)